MLFNDSHFEVIVIPNMYCSKYASTWKFANRIGKVSSCVVVLPFWEWVLKLNLASQFECGIILMNFISRSEIVKEDILSGCQLSLSLFSVSNWVLLLQIHSKQYSSSKKLCFLRWKSIFSWLFRDMISDAVVFNWHLLIKCQCFIHIMPTLNTIEK